MTVNVYAMTEPSLYKAGMMIPVELLSYELQDKSVKVEGAPDNELVAIATRCIRVLYEIAVASGANPEILKIVMRNS